MREFSIPTVAPVEAGANLTDVVWSDAADRPRQVRFLRRESGRWSDVTCAQFRDEVAHLARGLIAAGVEPGSRVALMSRTRYEWSLVDYAIWACGGVTVPLYETSSEEQVAWVLSDSGAVACVVETPAHTDLVATVRDGLPDLRQVWCIDAGDLDRLDTSGVAAGEVDARRRATNADDMATIVYTSGTTGRPKGCVLSHRNLLSDATNAIPVMPHVFRPGASTLLFLPLAHTFARMIQIGCVQARAVMGHAPDPKNLLADLQEFRPTFLLAIPRVFEKVYDGARQRAGGGLRGALFRRGDQVATGYSRALDRAGGPGLVLRLEHWLFDRLLYRKLRAALGGRCTAAISGGAPLGERLAHFFRGIGVTIYEGYGLTETSPGVSLNVADAIRIGTVGRPLPGVSVRIADDHEVLVRGDIVFSGYWNNPEATAEVLDEDGWFHTGDLGALDNDGYLTITGRKKELIVTASGKNVAPAVLEERLRAHPMISQGMVIGDQKPFIAALVTLDEETWPRWLESNHKPAGATVEALREDPDLIAEVRRAVADANRAVSRAEEIKVFRILPRDFSEEGGELTPTLKVKRSVVQREYADEIDAIYRR